MNVQGKLSRLDTAYCIAVGVAAVFLATMGVWRWFDLRSAAVLRVTQAAVIAVMLVSAFGPILQLIQWRLTAPWPVIAGWVAMTLFTIVLLQAILFH